MAERSRLSTVCGLALVLLVCASSAIAGTRRDDVADDAFTGLAALSAFDAVGFVSGNTPEFAYTASGTLISDQWVLTAGHVVDAATNLTFTIGGSNYTADLWGAHPNWDGNLLAGYDLGLFRLDAPVNNVAPATRYSAGEEAFSQMTTVGFGLTGTGISGATTFDGTKRAGTNNIGLLLSDRVMLADFDDPALKPGLLESLLPHMAETDLEYLAAPGDSGGGMFIDNNGTWELAGVNSFIAGLDGNPDSNYGDWQGGVRVGHFNDWIDEVLDGSITLTAGGATGTGYVVNGAMHAASDEIPEPTALVLLVAGSMAISRRRR